MAKHFYSTKTNFVSVPKPAWCLPAFILVICLSLSWKKALYSYQKYLSENMNSHKVNDPFATLLHLLSLGFAMPGLALR